MQPKREYPSSTIAFSSSRVMPLKASREVWSTGVEEVGVDGSNNPIEYTGETSRPSAAYDGIAAATQIAANMARIIFVSILTSFPSPVEDWVREKRGRFPSLYDEHHAAALDIQHKITFGVHGKALHPFGRICRERNTHARRVEAATAREDLLTALRTAS